MPPRCVLLGLLLAIWRARAEPLNLSGINYSLRIGPDWTWGPERCKSFDRVVAELRQLQSMGITNHVRVYSMNDCDTGLTMLRAVKQVPGMKLWLGLWVGPDNAGFTGERDRLLFLLNDPDGQFDDIDWTIVTGVHVSSEAVYRKDITADAAFDLRNIVKSNLDSLGKLNNIPITIADIGDTHSQHTQLITADPLAVTINAFPFWERSAIDINGHGNGVQFPSAAEYLLQRIQPVVQRLQGRQLIISETGWADSGANTFANPATPQAMAKWMRDFVCLARAQNFDYFWFDSFDSDWRRVNEQKPDDVEGHFGIFDEFGNLKPQIRDLVIDCDAAYADIDPDSMELPAAAQNTPAPETPAPIETATSPPTPMPITPATLSPTIMPADPITDAPTVMPADPITDAPTVMPADPITDAPTVMPIDPITDAPTTVPVNTSIGVPTIMPMELPTVAPALAITELPTSDSASSPVSPTSTPVAPSPPPPENDDPTLQPVEPTVPPVERGTAVAPTTETDTGALESGAVQIRFGITVISFLLATATIL